MTTPDDAGEPIAYELRATLNDGSRMSVGPFRTHAATTGRARLLLGVQAVRVETVRRVGGRMALVGVIGRPMTPERGDDDGLTPRHDEGGLIWRRQQQRRRIVGRCNRGGRDGCAGSGRAVWGAHHP